MMTSVLLYVPKGKAIVPVEKEGKKDCKDCFFHEFCERKQIDRVGMACFKDERNDGEEIIFVLDDYPAEKEKTSETKDSEPLICDCSNCFIINLPSCPGKNNCINSIGDYSYWMGARPKEEPKKEAKDYTNPTESAFPVLNSDGEGTTGMSLRDYFAGRALSRSIKQAWAEYNQGELDDWTKVYARAAEIAYITADAMFAKREGTNNG